MGVHFSKLALTLPLLVAACGSQPVDLDHSTLIPSTDPTSLGTVREQVTKIAVDEQRLYWSGSASQLNNGSGGPFSLHSCAKNDCVGTLLTYSGPTPSREAAPLFGVEQGEIYWLRDNQGGSDLVASSVLAPAATRLVLPHTQSVMMMAIDARGIYVSDGAIISSVPLSGAAQATQLAVLSDIRAEVLHVQGDYLYWIGSTGRAQGMVQRLRADGNGTVETLASGFERDTTAVGLWSFNQGGLALDTAYVYWGVNLNAGSIQRCPLTGCAEAPEVLATPIRVPSALLVDQGTLYFQHETDAFQYAVSSCALGHCERTTTVTNDVNAPDVLALDDQYLYTATTAQDLSPSDQQVTPVAQIRRLPK